MESNDIISRRHQEAKDATSNERLSVTSEQVNGDDLGDGVEDKK